MEVASRLVLCFAVVALGLLPPTILLAQPGIDEAIKKASDSGYEAILVVVVMASFMLGMTWIVRTWFTQAYTREERMARRIDTLEQWQRETLTEMVAKNTAAFTNLFLILESRPCLLADKDRMDELRSRHEGGKI
jgi:hypothetical protein